ncbi:VCBS domain-containing protein [Sphingorhabdus sp.]|uniref:VCBS domain-containing protein n=1 Tax=Sphingorhabdus sp. TaxID=1902408 RepID=UPI0035B04A5E
MADGQTAVETFSYTISDGKGGTSSAVLSLKITGANDAPVAVADTASLDASASVAWSYAQGDVLVNDSDPDAGDRLSVVAVNGSADYVGTTLLGTYGTLTMLTSGAYTYALDNNNLATKSLADGQTAVETFSYTISDGKGGTSSAVLSLKITGANDPPVAVADHLDAAENNLITFDYYQGSVVDNDVDSDEDGSIRVTAVNGLTENVGTTISGTYGFLTMLSSGAYTYALDHNRPATNALAENEFGYDIYQYTIVDSHGLSSVGYIYISISGVNDTPNLFSAEMSYYSTSSSIVYISPNFTLNDVDSLTLALVEVELQNYQRDQDTLVYGGSAMFDATWNPVEGKLSISASLGTSPSISNWEEALRSIGYINSSDNPVTVPRGIHFTVRDILDAGAPSASAYASILFQNVMSDPRVIGNSPGTPAISDLNKDGWLEPFGFFNNQDGTYSVNTDIVNILGTYPERIQRDNRIVDLNGDGKLDIFLNVYSSPEKMESYSIVFYSSEIDTNYTVQELLNVRGFGETIVAADFDNDGSTDIFSPVYTYAGTSPSNYLFLNKDGFLINNYATEWNIDLSGYPQELKVEGAHAVDINFDGKIDIYTASILFLNSGSNFVQLPIPVGQFDEGSVLADFDNDGDFDLALMTLSYGPKLYEWQSNQFIDQGALGIGKFGNGGIGLNAFDIDQNGWIDLVCRFDDGISFFMNYGGVFVRVDQASPRFDTFAFGDMDNNGMPDLIARAGSTFYQLDNLAATGQTLLLNVMGANGELNQHGRAVRLTSLSNPDLILARSVDSGSGFLSQNQYQMMIGLPVSGEYLVEVYLADRVISFYATAGQSVDVYADGRVQISPTVTGSLLRGSGNNYALLDEIENDISEGNGDSDTQYGFDANDDVFRLNHLGVDGISGGISFNNVALFRSDDIPVPNSDIQINIDEIENISFLCESKNEIILNDLTIERMSILDENENSKTMGMEKYISNILADLESIGNISEQILSSYSLDQSNDIYNYISEGFIIDNKFIYTQNLDFHELDSLII